MRLFRFWTVEGKGQGRNKAKVKAAYGGVSGENSTETGANCTALTVEHAGVWGEEWANCTEQRMICTVWRFWSVNRLVRITRALTFG